LKTSIRILIVVLILFFSVSLINAAPNANASNSSSQVSQQRNTNSLTGANLKACQNKEKSLQKRSDQLVKTTENMIENFDKIADHVKGYYTDTVIPAGKTVANYDDLLAAIAEKKLAAKEDLAQAEVGIDDLNCESNSPKDLLTQFRTDMLVVKKDLQEYRAAINDLIVAVRSSTGTENSSNNQDNE